jgi:AhpD family alkylhydroperoxidase
MSRLPVAPTIDAAPAAAQPLLQAVNTQLGMVPNLFRLLAASPAALEGMLGLSGTLGKGALDAKTRQRIALTVAEVNGCSYCLSAHAYIGKNLLKLSDAEIDANRSAGSDDAKAATALRFAKKVVQARGHSPTPTCRR